jgi:hypothetical protein
MSRKAGSDPVLACFLQNSTVVQGKTWLGVMKMKHADNSLLDGKITCAPKSTLRRATEMVIDRKALLGAAVASVLMVGQAHAFTFSDTLISFLYGPSYKEPAIVGPIAKKTISFTHVDGYKYGTNFFNIDAIKSDNHDPANGGATDDGAMEFYAVYRHTLSGNAVSGTKAFSVGPIADVGLEFGFDVNSKNTAFAPNKRLLVIGPQFQFDLPGKGFLSISLVAAQEWGHNGLNFGNEHSIQFDTNVIMENAWALPFTLIGVDWNFKGFANIVSPKGKDTFGNQTKTEFLIHPKLMADVGKLIGIDRHIIEAGVGWQYWYNKFGNDHKTNAGTIESTPFLEVSYRF